MEYAVFNVLMYLMERIGQTKGNEGSHIYPNRDSIAVNKSMIDRECSRLL